MYTELYKHRQMYEYYGMVDRTDAASVKKNKTKQVAKCVSSRLWPFCV